MTPRTRARSRASFHISSCSRPRAEAEAEACGWRAPPPSWNVHGLAFRAPLAGRVYFRPSPDEPRFVEVGSVIGGGTTVCMLEVMKSFNRIGYDSDSLPDRARVGGFLIADGADVELGTPILRLELSEG